jgi:RNA polymerase sigma-70 factor (ECF subfamily)
VTERHPDMDTRSVADAVDELLPLMTRLARLYVSGDGEVGTVIRETWLDTLGRGDDDHMSLRVRVVRSLIRLLTDRGHRRPDRDGGNRWPHQDGAGRRDPGNPARAHVDAGRFLPSTHPVWPGHWAQPPHPPGELPVLIPGTAAAQTVVRSTLGAIPALEAEVLLLRDVERWNAAEVCETLGLSNHEQRALLHSGRERVRRALEGFPERN